MLDDLMKQLAKDLELDERDLKTEVPGVYAMPIEDNVNVIMRENPQGLFFTCTLCAMPKSGEEIFYAELLGANLFGQTTRGAVLGLSEDGNRLTLSQLIEYNIKYKEFNEKLEDFLNVADFWRTETINYNNAIT